MHILFIDDVEDTRFLFWVVFQMDGHSTCLAADGLEAVHNGAASQEFDGYALGADQQAVQSYAVRVSRVRQR
jgi:CheY-like chemotaxis protein